MRPATTAMALAALLAGGAFVAGVGAEPAPAPLPCDQAVGPVSLLTGCAPVPLRACATAWPADEACAPPAEVPECVAEGQAGVIIAPKVQVCRDPCITVDDLFTRVALLGCRPVLLGPICVDAARDAATVAGCMPSTTLFACLSWNVVGLYACPGTCGNWRVSVLTTLGSCRTLLATPFCLDGPAWAVPAQACTVPLYHFGCFVLACFPGLPVVQPPSSSEAAAALPLPEDFPQDPGAGIPAAPVEPRVDPTRDTAGGPLVASGIGDATCGTEARGHLVCVVVSGTGEASCTGNATVCLAVSGTGRAGGDPAQGVPVGVSGTGPSRGTAAFTALGPSDGEVAAASLDGTSVAGIAAASGAGASTAGYAALAGAGTASGGALAVAGAGASDSGYLAATGAGDARSGLVALAGHGLAESGGVAVAGGGTSNSSLLAVNALGNASGLVAVSGTGVARGSLVAASATGDAASCPAPLCTAASGTGTAAGGIAASATGPASGVVAVSVCNLSRGEACTEQVAPSVPGGLV